MFFWIIIRSALASLWANKMRSVLAMLGIIIGVGAVIAMLAIGAGARQRAMAQISAMGTNTLVIRPGQRGQGGVTSGVQQNLTIDDATALMQLPYVERVAPVAGGGMAQVKYFSRNTRTTVTGTTVTYLAIRNFKIDTEHNPESRFFSEAESEGLTDASHVAVIGPQTAENLMGEDDPIGQDIKINGMKFRVVGILKAKGDQGYFNPDDQIIIPLRVAIKQVFGRSNPGGSEAVREIDMQADDVDHLDELQTEVTRVLRQRHQIRGAAQDDFFVRNQADILAAANETNAVFTILLGSIAGISLLVGGIGIMNIMLVTVTERTREIGVRKAIGAKDRDILSQFLIEAIIMCGLGGLVGVAAGVLAALALNYFTSFTTAIQLWSVVLSLGFATAVGVFFGFYPAQRASQLDPIEALRYE